jgi:hypothetical protein
MPLSASEYRCGSADELTSHFKIFHADECLVVIGGFAGRETMEQRRKRHLKLLSRSVTPFESRAGFRTAANFAALCRERGLNFRVIWAKAT